MFNYVQYESHKIDQQLCIPPYRESYETTYFTYSTLISKDT